MSDLVLARNCCLARMLPGEKLPLPLHIVKGADLVVQ